MITSLSFGPIRPAFESGVNGIEKNPHSTANTVGLVLRVILDQLASSIFFQAKETTEKNHTISTEWETP